MNETERWAYLSAKVWGLAEAHFYDGVAEEEVSLCDVVERWGTCDIPWVYISLNGKKCLF